MQIVIPGALPPPPYDSELAKLLAERAPALVAWFERGTATQSLFDPTQAGCSSYEAWQLRRAGAPDVPGQPLGAALGPWLAGEQASGPEPVWLGELVHFALGSDRASLLDPEQMDIAPAESEALLAAALPWFEGTGFVLETLSPERCRLRLPPGVVPNSVSPRVLAGQPLDAWWQLDTALRPWRRLLNEIQMVWHEHPVNEARAARGVAPINGLWLYGGARPWTPPAAPDPDIAIADTLRAAHDAGDWSRWLDGCAALDQEILRPLSASDGAPRAAMSMLLLGERRSVRLDINPRGRLFGLLPAPKKNWKSWWSLPA
jgi:hypothetical protein